MRSLSFPCTIDNLQGLSKASQAYPAVFPDWRAIALNAIPGVGILTFPSKQEMHSTFVTSDSPVEVRIYDGPKCRYMVWKILTLFEVACNARIVPLASRSSNDFKVSEES